MSCSRPDNSIRRWFFEETVAGAVQPRTLREERPRQIRGCGRNTPHIIPGSHSPRRKARAVFQIKSKINWSLLACEW